MDNRLLPTRLKVYDPLNVDVVLYDGPITEHVGPFRTQGNRGSLVAQVFYDVEKITYEELDNVANNMGIIQLDIDEVFKDDSEAFIAFSAVAKVSLYAISYEGDEKFAPFETEIEYE